MKLYLKFFSMHLRCCMEYKMSFLFTVLGLFLTSFTTFLGVHFMFQRFPSVEGFSYSEVLICYSVVLMAYSLAECFARGFDTFRSTISNGEFDRILVRPRNEIFLVLANKIEFNRIGRLLQSVVMLTVALAGSGIVMTLPKVLVLIAMILGGMALFSGLYLIYASICFFTIEGLEFMNIFTDGGRELGKYPLVIYGRLFLGFFTFIVPLSLVQYYPLLFLLGRTTSAANAIAPLGGMLFLLPSWFFWRFGVRHYRSTGS